MARRTDMRAANEEIGKHISPAM